MDVQSRGHEVSAAQLAAAIDDAASDLVIVDVRAPGEVARWRIEGSRPLSRIERPYWDLLDTPEAIAGEMGASLAVVVCAYGNTSQIIAEQLRSAGHDAVSLAGGMVAWSQVHVVRPAARLGTTGYVVQLDRPAKGCLSYVVGVERGPAIVVDPDRYHDDYLAAVEMHRSYVVGVVDTHLHADHISGAAGLAALTGVTYYLADDEGAAVDHVRPSDGDRLIDGMIDATVVALHTPGHTPGSTGIRVDDALLLSGDTLFVRGVGRPDLGGQAVEWARQLHDTLTHKLGIVGDDAVVLPAHYQDPSERGHTGIYAAQLGELRRGGEFASDLEGFLDRVIASTRPAPAEYERIRRVNLGLDTPPAADLDELEIGKNRCAAAPAGP